ncbi:MAG TPA: DUF4430 domain-containing protein [Patescibacteria group bacterium]|jgi:hypothetical protein|nr:DUF4430 domain-containing protein [Patescibacteria group bacterium]
MFRNFKKFETFVIAAIIAVIGIVYAFTKQPVMAPSNHTEQTSNTSSTEQSQQPTYPTQEDVQQVPASTITYKGVDGKNALELLQASHQVEVKHYSFGDMVISIDGVMPDPNTHFWSFYVNGQLSQVGASAYVTKSSDILEWKIEKINM